MGWNQGKGLGKKEQGIINPLIVNKCGNHDDQSGEIGGPAQIM